MSLLPVAFLMGFLGSLHCAVMCGPLVLSLPLNKNGFWHSVGQVLLYQLGRVTVYTLLGLLIGLLGSTVSLYTGQENFSLAVGVFIIVIALLQLSGSYFSFFAKFQSLLIKPVSILFGKISRLPFWGFFAGFLNGLIPCGMVYLALAAAINLNDYQAAGRFMAWFGLGTTPMMVFISLSGVYLKKYFRFNTQKLLPWFMLAMGVLLVLRASSLGIPFISPSLHHGFGSADNCG